MSQSFSNSTSFPMLRKYGGFTPGVVQFSDIPKEDKEAWLLEYWEYHNIEPVGAPPVLPFGNYQYDLAGYRMDVGQLGSGFRRIQLPGGTYVEDQATSFGSTWYEQRGSKVYQVGWFPRSGWARLDQDLFGKEIIFATDQDVQDEYDWSHAPEKLDPSYVQAWNYVPNPGRVDDPMASAGYAKLRLARSQLIANKLLDWLPNVLIEATRK